MRLLEDNGGDFFVTVEDKICEANQEIQNNQLYSVKKRWPKQSDDRMRKNSTPVNQ